MNTATSNPECPICAADIGPSTEFFWHEDGAPCWPLRDPMGAHNADIFRRIVERDATTRLNIWGRPDTPRHSSHRRVDDLDIHSYAEADRELGSRRTRRVANNTWLIRGDACIMVRLHTTHIITYWADGRIEFNTGGYHTHLTRDRLARFAPHGCTVYAGRHGYVLWDGTHEIPFDGDQQGIETLIIAARSA